MRRKKQQLAADESAAILSEGVFGVMGTGGTDGVPYAVPLSYAYDGAADPDGGAPCGRIYLHCAPAGHKLDAIAENPGVTFAVVGHNVVAPEQLTNIYRSAIAFGCARLARDDDEKRRGLLALGRKYCPGLDDLVDDEIARDLKRTTVVVIDVEEITGKEAIELVREREQ